MISRMSTDLPVPADPVKKTLFFLSSTRLKTCCCSSLRKTLAGLCWALFAFLSVSSSGSCFFMALLLSSRCFFCCSFTALAVVFQGYIDFLLSFGIGVKSSPPFAFDVPDDTEGAAASAFLSSHGSVRLFVGLG